MPTLARAHEAATLVGWSSEWVSASIALKPPSATSLPRLDWLSAICWSTSAAERRRPSDLECATSSAITRAPSSCTSWCARARSCSGSSSLSDGAAPMPPAASWRICSICALSISRSRFFWSSCFSRATQSRRKVDMSEKWKAESSLAALAEAARLTSEPKRTLFSTRWALTSGMSARNMSASTAHRWTVGATLASSKPRVAVSSRPVGLMPTRCCWWSKQTLASATHARQRTRGLGDLSMALRCLIGSSPALSRKCCGSLAACA
mmetsp:Transcript_288/g.952  ORF Transcript_288/g.952 Transcript_288/m.952 type:complete len:265 (+) Transcript_288:775-1569(+)